jgi:hypothetical protein
MSPVTSPAAPWLTQKACSRSARWLQVLAEKLRSKTELPESRSNPQYCRYLYYLGRIRAVQLEYSAAKDCLTQVRTRQLPRALLEPSSRCEAPPISARWLRVTRWMYLTCSTEQPISELIQPDPLPIAATGTSSTPPSHTLRLLHAYAGGS